MNPAFFPYPQKVSFGKGKVALEKSIRIVPLDQEAEYAAQWLSDQIGKRHGIRATVTPRFDDCRDSDVILIGKADNDQLKNICSKQDISFAQIPEEGYRLCLMTDRKARTERLFSVLAANDRRGFIYGAHAFLRAIKEEKEGPRLPACDITDYPAVQIRPITVSVGWGQIFEGPCRWNLNQWFSFLDLLSEYRYNVLYLLNWMSELVFPYNWLEIRHYRWIREFNLLPTLELDKWDGRRFVKVKWQHPFLKNPETVKEIVRYARNLGIKPGFFADPKFFCVYNEEPWLRYWRHIIEFLMTEYQLDVFLFEEEETCEPHDHLISCRACQKRWGKLPLSRVRFEAYKHTKLMEIIKQHNPNAMVSAVCHFSLDQWSMFDPLTYKAGAKTWIDDKKLYFRALNEFKRLAPENLRFSHTPAKGKHSAFRKIFGPQRIIKAGYNWYWPTISEEKELSQPAVANTLWRGDSINTSENAAKALLFGAKSHYPQLVQRTIYYRRKRKYYPQALRSLLMFNGLDNPDALAKIKELSEKNRIKMESFLRKAGETLKKTRRLERAMEQEIKKIESSLITRWSPRDNAMRVLAAFRKSTLALEYLLAYGDFLMMKGNDAKLIEAGIRRLEEIGRKICDCMATYIPDWPGTGSRMELKYGGRYTALQGNPFIYDGYLKHAWQLKADFQKNKIAATAQE